MENSLDPQGSLLLRTLAMPSDANVNGDIFGGWIMAQMDLGGGILAKELSQGRTVTVAVDAITFLKPVNIGDIVCCYGKCVKTGRTSMTIQIEIWVKKVLNQGISNKQCVCRACFTYVGVNEHGRPRPLPPEQQHQNAQ